MKIKSCRSCNSKSLTKLYSLGKQSLTGIFPPNKKTKITKGNLSMVMCKKCKLLQLENNFNPFEMYGDNYGYMSSLNKSMISHLQLKSINLKNKFRNLAPIAIKYMKKNLNIAETGDLNLSLNQEALHMMICSETEDHKNAARAFVNKEKVVFKGK